MGQRSPEAMPAFWAYDKAALADGAMPKPSKARMALAVALTTPGVSGIERPRQEARKAGGTEQERAEAVHVAGALRAGAALTHGTHLCEG